MSLSYLVPADVLRFYDSRRVLQLASDTGNTAVVADLSNASSAAYGFMQQAIRSAASDLDSHCQQGKRYSRDILENIIADALAFPADEAKQKRAALIQQLVADLAYGIMASRRGYVADALKQLAPRYEAALVTLERLADGIQIFDTDAAISAGVPSSVKIGKNKFRPSLDNRMFGLWPDSYNRYGAC